MFSNASNSIQLIGNLGRDIILRSLDSGKVVATAPIATNDYYTNDKGEKMKNTQWHNLVAWGKLAENMSSTLAKGQKVVVQGKLVHRSYVDKDGNIKYTSEIKVREFKVTDKVERKPLPF